MSRCRAMNRRRSAAISLLVFCLDVSAISPFAARSLSTDSLIPQSPLGVAASDVGFVLVLGNKVEKPSDQESQPAVVRLPGCLRLFGADGGLFRGGDDGTPPALVASAADIRGPPQPNHN